jgi:hypothetical protein
MVQFSFSFWPRQGALVVILSEAKIEAGSRGLCHSERSDESSQGCNGRGEILHFVQDDIMRGLGGKPGVRGVVILSAVKNLLRVLMGIVLLE